MSCDCVSLRILCILEGEKLNELVKSVKQQFNVTTGTKLPAYTLADVPSTSGCRWSPARPRSRFQELLLLYLVRMEHFPL